MKKILRILIVAEVVLGSVGVVVDMLLEKTLPEEMQDYIVSSEIAEIGFTQSIGLIFGTLLIILLIVAWVGLWNLWRHARLLYTVCWVLGPLLYLVLEPVVYYFPLGATLSDYSILTSGIILGIIYLTELKYNFRKEHIEY